MADTSMATRFPLRQVPRAKSAIRIWLAKIRRMARNGPANGSIRFSSRNAGNRSKGGSFRSHLLWCSLCCWIWSIWGVMMMGPNVYFGVASAGMNMFGGYFVILAFPLLVIVPLRGVSIAGR